MNNSALKTLNIFEFIANSAHAVGISEISRELGYPKSTVFDIVSVLLSRGYIEIDVNNGKAYHVGMSAFSTGSQYINRMDVYKVAHAVLTGLRDEIGETAYLAVERNGYLLYLDKIEGNGELRSSCNIGSQNYMHVTGLGKALLAAYPDEKVKELMDGKFIYRTEKTLMNYEALLEELERIRTAGYATDSGEDLELLRCIAAPVRDFSGAAVAAVSVAMLKTHFTEEKAVRSIAGVCKAALQISKKIGYIGENLYT